MRIGRIMVALTCVAAVACGETDPLNINGSVTFDHTDGFMDATFSAVGRIPLSADFTSVPWAAGSRDDADDLLIVTAFAPRDQNRYDRVVVVVPRLTPGAAPITDITSCGAGLATCAFVTVEFGASEDDEIVLRSCALDAGTVTLATITDGRATGGFSGSGRCFYNDGHAWTFTISDGVFDVPLVAEADLP